MLKTSVNLAFSIALLLGTNGAFAVSSEDFVDGANPSPSQYTGTAGPDEAEVTSTLAPEATSHYLFVAGSALVPRSGSTTVTYNGAGCVSAVGDYLTTDLQLPAGSTLEGVRTYYYDNAATGSVSSAITRYDGSGGFLDLLIPTLPHATGYANGYNVLATPEVIDNVTYSYVLLASTGTGTRICGLRVFYSTP